MDEIQNVKIVSTIKNHINALSKKQRAIALVAIILVTILSIVSLIVVSSNNVKGKYDFYRISIDGEGISMDDAGYMEIVGVDNDKTSMFYIDLFGSTSRMKGKVYEIREFDEYTKYRFEVKTQSGSALEDMEYFYFYYYPDRGDNGIIEVEGNGATLYFKRSK